MGMQTVQGLVNANIVARHNVESVEEGDLFLSLVFGSAERRWDGGRLGEGAGGNDPWPTPPGLFAKQRTPTTRPDTTANRSGASPSDIAEVAHCSYQQTEAGSDQPRSITSQLKINK